MKTIQMAVLSVVSFPLNEIKSEDHYFENESDAKKVSELPLGWYGGKGYLSEKTFMPDKLPKYYTSVMDFIEQRMTIAEARKYGLVK